MKKVLSLFLTAMMVVSLTACGKTKNTQNETSKEISKEFSSQSTVQEKDSDEKDPATVLDEITSDFTDVTAQLTESLTDTFTSVGGTYEDYQQNKDFVDEWITLVLSESDALFTRTKENSIVYFKLIAADEDRKYSEFCEEALDEYYDTVYDDAMDKYYDALYDDAMDDLYEEYYDGIIEDAYDDIEYKEWSDASSECYKQWSEACSTIYTKWSDASSYIYGLWSAIDSAFCWNDNFDVDAIVSEYEKEKAEEDAESAEEAAKQYSDLDVKSEDSGNNEESESSEPAQSKDTETAADGIRPEFKEAMDSYESFYTEYCEFMKEYRENSTDLSLMAKYTDMLTKAEEMDKAFEEWNEDEMNDEELEYYFDVNNRVMNMLLDAIG